VAVDVLPGAPRNGMPSLHFAWALATNSYRHRALAAGLVMLAAWLAWLAWGGPMFAGIGRAHWLPMALTLWLVLRLGGRLLAPDER
jgi:hypothetical protein